MFGTRKLGKTSAQRKALLRQQVTDLLANGKMETTFYRAKEVQPVVEKMITLGKKGDLAAYRKALSFITKEDVAHKLSFHHLCNSRKFHIQTTFLITANGAYPGNCSSADFSAASPASRSVSASNSCPMMMHGAVTPAPFQPATLM